MKKRLYAVMGLLLAAGILAGCSAKYPGLAELQGEWVGSDGGSVLELKGNTLTLTSGGWKASCRVRLSVRGDGTYLAADGDGSSLFGLMTPLEVCGDGSLSAREIVHDGRSHGYRFVRRDAPEPEAADAGPSPGAPAQIVSEDISSFVLVFNNSGGSYGLDQRWERGKYDWEVFRESGGFSMLFDVSGPSYKVFRFTGQVSGEYVKGLAGLLKECGAVGHNGCHAGGGSDTGYSLYVVYASGEVLSVSADGSDPGCLFDLAALLDYAEKQDLRGQ